jgi:hypothetical protein
MDDDSTRPPRTRKRRQRRSAGTGLALAGLLLTIGSLGAACGGASKDPGAASAPSISTTPSNTRTSTTATPSGSSGSSSSAQSSQAEDLRLAQCMRANGVPNFPDPPANGAMLSALGASGVNPGSPAFRSALQACKQYNASANLTPAQNAAQNAEGLGISQCMRSHGVPNFPDPTTGPLGEQVINMHGTGIDPQSPTYQEASEACQKLFPGSK